MNKFPLFKHNSYYRLGDVILKRGGWQSSREKVFKDDFFKDSLLRLYLNRLEEPLTEDYNSEALRESCLEKTSTNLLDDTIYINIRLGDVVQRPFWYAKYNQETQFYKLSEWFIFNHKLLIDKIEHMLSSNPKISSITFVGVLHFGDKPSLGDWVYCKHDEDLNYSLFDILNKKIKVAFPNLKQKILNLEVQDQIEIADTQFLTLSNARHVLLEKTSGFSMLVKDVRKII
jgi:hypothetical protein